MWQTIATAVLGALGILVAAFAPSRQTRRAEDRLLAQEFRVAPRRVAHELGRCALSLEGASADPNPQPIPADLADAIFPTHAWDEHERVLALGLRDDDWAIVAMVYEELRNQREIALIMPVPLPNTQRSAMAAAAAHARKAQELLVNARFDPARLP
jgi:hypothetical protein